ncbi:CheR family methyltransferase [Devosia sp.]|uniref:CheR family methyltransferase n=1 Tax=Devosia sp. TaxID=1871048 RepID=UPI003266EFE5
MAERASTKTEPRRPPDDDGITASPAARLFVAIGASAGGLDACTRLVAAMPLGQGIAIILVQHLDPNHDSLMVELLANKTGLTVEQASEGATLQSDHLYVIPPGAYLTVAGGIVHLEKPPDHHGARMPFDMLLDSLARNHGRQTAAVVLSGTGNDGSAGVKAVKRAGGICIAQEPTEAGYDAMPLNAIATGSIDRVATAAAIPAAILQLLRTLHKRVMSKSTEHDMPPDELGDIIQALKIGSTQDFGPYKQGTVRRRIERRMALVGLLPGAMGKYLELVRSDAAEQEQLASDLLINVTSFFRDAKVFDYLADKIIPKLIADAVPNQKLRVWTAGCSSGEESYSMAMLFDEAIAASGKPIAVQIFASDADADAIATAREGLYPKAIAADVSPARLKRFFFREDDHYRVLPKLRAMVAFSVQNVLSDPPFSRLDLISCRNLLIYLSPDAQGKVISLFHFALRKDGILFLGAAETVGGVESGFELISKPEKLYRQIGRVRPAEIGVTMSAKPQAAGAATPPAGTAKQISLAELCRRLVMDRYAPAAVLIDAQNACIFSMGPTDHYLRIAPGYPTTDLLEMAAPGLKLKLRATLQKVREGNARIVAAGGKSRDFEVPFNIDVQPVSHEGADLLLICFVDSHAVQPMAKRGRNAVDGLADMERELEATKADLQDALHDLESSSQEHKAINEEALSVNEEYQSTNEELLTSKEELQSLNEELTALNSQLQETLERQRTTSNDLQNVLYSTDLATIFLDTKLNIRFFTPATRALFNVIPGDIGRPLADLNALATDSAMLTDAAAVMKSRTPIEREIEARTGAWFIRRILPYRAEDGSVEGVVITFANITERRHTAEALEAAEHKARTANVAKSRFLAAASHDLRQPLQSLKLVQGMLSKAIHDESSKKLLARLDDTVGAMSGMLNTLLDINQIEAGTVQASKAAFPIDNILRRLRGEFTYVAQSQGLVLRVIPSRLVVFSDPHLLEQMLRNLLSNALKYTKSGKVVLGCRRHRDTINVEILDTGIGIPKRELEAIFDEYHQLHNDARERSQGLGLGLSIVKRLGDLLDHNVTVRSRPNKGSCFAIEVTRAKQTAVVVAPVDITGTNSGKPTRPSAKILVVEDDPEIRDLTVMLLMSEGHEVMSTADGPLAIDLVGERHFRPDLVLADFNLPNGMDGIEVITDIRAILKRDIPAVVLTGDISTDTLQHIGLQDCLHFNKPVKTVELIAAIESALARCRHDEPLVSEAVQPRAHEGSTIYIVDDEPLVRSTILAVLEQNGLHALDYGTAEAFLGAYVPTGDECLVVDAYLPGMSGIELIRQLRAKGYSLPTIMITGSSDVTMAVDVMKAGAMDFIEKPVGGDELIASVRRAIEQSRDATKASGWRDDAIGHLAGLTRRQRQIMDLVLAGHPSKNIAADLHISQRTVENHRAAIMLRTGTRSLPALARLVIAATPVA